MWFGYFSIRLDMNFHFLQLTTNIYHTNSNQTCLTLITYNHPYDSTYWILIFFKRKMFLNFLKSEKKKEVKMNKEKIFANKDIICLGQDNREGWEKYLG